MKRAQKRWLQRQLKDWQHANIISAFQAEHITLHVEEASRIARRRVLRWMVMLSGGTFALIAALIVAGNVFLP